ncbi:murein transglycosylase [Orbaceae bacterium ac157xtp]
MKIKAGFCWLVLSCPFFSVATTKLPIENQRTQFITWQQNYASLTEDAQKKQLTLLKDYPLYPYAKYDFFMNHLNSVKSDEINQFINQYDDFPLNSNLIQSYLGNRTKQKKWADITKIKIDSSIASRCYYQYALFQLGQKKKALSPVKEIWLTGKDVVSACDPIFNEWSKTAERTPNLILLRIDLALQENNRKLAKYLTSQLPDNYKTLKKNLTAVLDSPQELDEFIKKVSPTPFSNKVVMYTFTRYAYNNPESAQKLLPTLLKKYKFNKEQQNSLLRSIANSYLNNQATDENIKWRDEFLVKDRDSNLLEKRIRLSLKQNDLKQVEYWIDLLPKTAKLKDEWQYWKAIALENKGQKDEATKILNELSKSRGFYAMYSAQKLDKPFELFVDYFNKDQKEAIEEQKLLQQMYQNQPFVQRIHELRTLNMLKYASMEWRNYLYHLKDVNQNDYAQLARYAYHQGWGDHSVQATIAGKLWDNWVERFPIIYHDYYKEHLVGKDIPISFALAITRQESALEASVQSPAGARGLMQLMPGTAKDTAKKIANLNYRSAEQLYDPAINIQLGTYYLDYIYQSVEHNRVLTAAAYNAGPNRLNRWLAETQNQLDVIAFIESIPYAETRNYVKSVLVYDYIYQLVLGEKPTMILNQNELTKKY